MYPADTTVIHPVSRTREWSTLCPVPSCFLPFPPPLLVPLSLSLLLSAVSSPFPGWLQPVPASPPRSASGPSRIVTRMQSSRTVLKSSVLHKSPTTVRLLLPMATGVISSTHSRCCHILQGLPRLLGRSQSAHLHPHPAWVKGRVTAARGAGAGNETLQRQRVGLLLPGKNYQERPTILCRGSSGKGGRLMALSPLLSCCPGASPGFEIQCLENEQGPALRSPHFGEAQV